MKMSTPWPAGQRIDRGAPVSPDVAPTMVRCVVAADQEFLEQQTEQLQRDVLERERGAVEQLEQPVAVVELDERRDRGMREAAIGLGAQAAQFLFG
jgi:hypothetical protein